MAKDQSDILKEILKNSKNPKAIEQAQAGLDEAKQARKAEIASQMKGSLSSTIAKSTGPINESTKDSDNIKEILKESKEQNTNLLKLIKLNEKSIEDNSELFGRLEKTMNAIVDALQEQKRQQTTSQTAPSNVSVPPVSPTVPPPSGGGGGFNLMDLIPDFFGNKNKTPAPEGTPKGNTGGGFLGKLLKTGAGIVGGGLLGSAAYGMMSPEQQEKAKALLGENADTVMGAGGAVVGGALGAKIGPKGAGVLSGVLEGAQSYQQIQEIDEKLKKGEITQEEATILKTRSATGGVGGTVGGVIGASVGSLAGPVGTLAGGYVGATVGRAVGETVPGLAGMQTEEEQKKYAEKTATEQKKIAQQKAQDNGEQYDELPAGHQKPRPSNPMQAQVWDSKYASGWNADGTPKGKVEPQAAPEPVLSDKEILEKKMNEPQDTFSKGLPDKATLEKKMNEPQDTFSIGAINYVGKKVNEITDDYNRGTSGTLEAQNLNDRIKKLMEEKGIDYNKAYEIARAEVEGKDPSAFMMSTQNLSSNREMTQKSYERNQDYSSAVETPIYDALGNYMGADVKTEYEKAGKLNEQTSKEGIVNNKVDSIFGSEFLGSLLSKKGLDTGSFLGTVSKQREFTGTDGKEEKSFDMGDIIGKRKSGGIFGSDEYEVTYGDDTLKVGKSDYMRMQQYIADGDPERAMTLFNTLNKKNIEASPIFKAQQEQMSQAVKQGDYKTAMNVAMNRTEDDFPKIETPTPESEKLNKLEQSGQAQNQAPIVLKGGDTVNNVVTNNNTSSGGSGGGAGSPSRIASPFDSFIIGRLWSPSP